MGVDEQIRLGYHIHNSIEEDQHQNLSIFPGKLKGKNKGKKCRDTKSEVSMSTSRLMPTIASSFTWKKLFNLSRG